MANGFGSVDYSKLDRLRSVLQEAAQRAMQTRQMQYNADIERLNLEMEGRKIDATNKLTQAYQKIMSGPGDYQTKAEQVSPLMTQAAQFNPQVAQYMQEGLGREYNAAQLEEQGKRLGLSSLQVEAGLKRLGIEQGRLDEDVRYHNALLSKPPKGSTADPLKRFKDQYTKLINENNKIDQGIAGLNWKDKATSEASAPKYKKALTLKLGNLQQIETAGKSAGWDTSWIQAQRDQINQEIQKTNEHYPDTTQMPPQTTPKTQRFNVKGQSYDIPEDQIDAFKKDMGIQ